MVTFEFELKFRSHQRLVILLGVHLQTPFSHMESEW